MDPMISMTASVLLAALLAAAGWHKLADATRFQSALAGYGLVPPVLVPAFAIVIPLGELGAAALIVVDATRTAGALIAAGLFALYGAAMAINLLRGRRDLDCGCSWGGARRTQTSGLSEGLVARNLVLVALALSVGLGSLTRPAGWFDDLNGILGGLALTLVWIAGDTFLANRRITRRGALS